MLAQPTNWKGKHKHWRSQWHRNPTPNCTYALFLVLGYFAAAFARGDFTRVRHENLLLGRRTKRRSARRESYSRPRPALPRARGGRLWRTRDGQGGLPVAQRSDHAGRDVVLAGPAQPAQVSGACRKGRPLLSPPQA